MPPVPWLIALVLALVACSSRPPVHDRSGETHYNRRELPARPGVFTGRTGEWTPGVPQREPARESPDDAECEGRDPGRAEGC